LFVKNPILVLPFAAAACAALLLSGPSFAQAPAAPAPAAPPPFSTAPVKIAIIQWDAALLSTKDGKAAQAELEKRLGPKQQDLQKRQDDIKGWQDQLSRGGTTMSDTKKTELQRQIDSGTKSLQRDSQDFQDEAQAEERKVYVDLSEKMQPVVKKFASENGLTLLLNISDQNTNVLWAADGIDITAAIIDAYDKTAPAAPSVTAPRPAAPKTPAPSASKPPVTNIPAAPSASKPPVTNTPAAPKPAPAK
jgi:outer membrane protein